MRKLPLILLTAAPFTFSDKSPENALKTVKISTDNSERPVYLSTVKNGEYYYPTIWTTANRLIMNEDSSYMFSGLTTVKDSTFRKLEKCGISNF